VSDPAKKRIFFMTYDHSECAMVVAPLAFICNVPANSKYCWLSFSHAYALGDGVNIEVKAHTRDGDKLLADRLVPPLAKADSPEWEDVQMELPAGTDQIRFRVYSQSGDSTGDWLAMRDCSFN